MNTLTKYLSITTMSLAWLGCAPAGSELQPDVQTDIATTTQAVVTDCDYLNTALTPALPVPVVYGRELMITDLAVVEDPCRSTNSPAVACVPSTVGTWTFGTLMRRMAGTRPLRPFVQEWVSTFEIGQVVNGFAVPARPNIRARFIDPWLIQSGCAAGDPIVGAGACPLDIAKAPFRLLAIVNRVDLSGAAFGATEPGEARFVFGMTDAQTGASLAATVIFEYSLPQTLDALGWATDWHLLSTMAPASAAYRTQLQMITDAFTLPGGVPGAPNFGTAISQIRTNDIALGFVWELREYTLQNIGLGPNRFGLRNDTVKGTPDDSMNGSAALDTYLVTDQPAILNFTHTVPSTLLGGRSTAPLAWINGGTAGPILPVTRHLFAFSTCNGCHLNETATAFVHVTPRGVGVPAGLSPFMSVPAVSAGAAVGMPAAFHTITDPFGFVFRYNEPWRRICESTRILNGDPTPFTKGNGAH